MAKHMLVVGASGLVGYEATRHFERLADWPVTAVSRREPRGLASAAHISVDLMDEAACRETFSSLSDVTHVIYAALHELPGNLVGGWRDEGQMQTNLSMLRNMFEPLEAAAGKLQHITLLQGTKAYGGHVAPMTVPAKERWLRHDHPNFYWLQEDYIRERQAGKGWNWTILRPQFVFGEAVKGNLNCLSALCVYASLEKEAGRAFSYPGGPAYLLEAVDTELLAKAFEWAAMTPECAGEHFNITNGDVFAFETVWPVIAEAFDMEVGEPNPQRLSETLPARQEEWAALVDKYQLAAPRDLGAFLGESAEFADAAMASGAPSAPPPVLVSTIKARQFGFHDCVDTEDMLKKWIEGYRERGLIPPV